MANAQRKAADAEEGMTRVTGRPIDYYLGGTLVLPDGVATRLSNYRTAIAELLSRLEKLVIPEHLPTITTLLHELEDFRVNVSLVGQVKAGKTMLTSALVSMPGLLPSDVNPWTSVVTSLHVNTSKPRGSTAVFSFYSHEEWANLTESGGQLGELAERAGFADELVEMRRQILEMQHRTENRLGPNFALLLGAQHRFDAFNSAVINRYVCLGEPDSPPLGSGRFADVTKLAELYLDDSTFDVPTTIHDTPGVNDPFLARERATLQTLSSTDICVVVLSAHQSFSTVDLGLMRILMAMQADQIVLYVNRIDELEDPDRQIREIDGFIRGILKEKGLSTAIPIVYGSAAWAERAVGGPGAVADVAAPDVLEALAGNRARGAEKSGSSGPLLLGRPPFSIEKTRDLSGLNELKALLAHKSIVKVAAPFSVDVLMRAMDLAGQSSLLMDRALDKIIPTQDEAARDALVDYIDQTLSDLNAQCDRAASAISDQMLLLMSTAYREFIEAESARIRETVKAGKRITDWTPDTEKLRRNLNAAYHAFVANGRKEFTRIYTDAASRVSASYARVVDDRSQIFAARAPRVIEPKTPAALMKTMTIDMKANWLGNFMARASGGEGFVTRFTATVTAEMNAFLTEMREVHVLEFVNQSRRVLADFMSDHVSTLQNLALFDDDEHGGAVRHRLQMEVEVSQRMVALKALSVEMQTLADAICSEFKISLK